jgi:pSer/pThr/pTyr-binding forkhead associated (FHA) protein
MAKLVIYQLIDGEETLVEDFELATQRLLIGSGRDNDLVLELAEVDPIHASMELRNEYWVLQDMGGPGGTVVNGVEITGPFRLHHGDVIELGNIIRLRFQDSTTSPENIHSVTSAALAGAEDGPVQSPMRGRVWFAGVAGVTLAIVFIIVFLLIVADYLDLIQITDLLPPWFG